MDVDNLMVSDGSADMYTDSLRFTLESFIPYLRVHPQTESIDIATGVAIQFDRDLAGLLKAVKNVTPDMVWVVMRTNYLNNPSDYTADMLSLLIPSAAVVNQIRQGDQSTTRINS